MYRLRVLHEKGQLEYIAYKFVLTSPAVPCIYGLSNFDSFCDGWKVAVHLVFCRCCHQDLFNMAVSILV